MPLLAIQWDANPEVVRPSLTLCEDTDTMPSLEALAAMPTPHGWLEFVVLESETPVPH